MGRRIELRICISGVEYKQACKAGSCVSKRIGSFDVYVTCVEGECGDLEKILEGINESVVRRLQVMCSGAGGCSEASIEDGMLCCRTMLEPMPGLASLISALRKRGIEVHAERGQVIICAGIERGLEEAVEAIRSAFLLLESVYDTQRRIAEGVAKSITVGGLASPKGRGHGERGQREG